MKSERTRGWYCGRGPVGEVLGTGENNEAAPRNAGRGPEWMMERLSRALQVI